MKSKLKGYVNNQKNQRDERARLPSGVGRKGSEASNARKKKTILHGRNHSKESSNTLGEGPDRLDKPTGACRSEKRF